MKQQVWNQTGVCESYQITQTYDPICIAILTVTAVCKNNVHKNQKNNTIPSTVVYCTMRFADIYVETTATTVQYLV